MKTFFSLATLSLFVAPVVSATHMEKLDMETVRALSCPSVDSSRQHAPRDQYHRSKSVREESIIGGVLEDEVSAFGAGRIRSIPPQRSQSVPLIVYETLKDEERFVKIMNPFHSARFVRKGTFSERLLVNSRTNDPRFLDASQPHGLNLEAIHKRGAALRRLGDGGEDLSSYVHTAQRMIALLNPLEERMQRPTPKEIGDDPILESILLEVNAKVSRYHLALALALRKIGQMTGVSIEKLKFLPGKEKN